MVRLGDVGKVITGNTPKTSDSKNYTSNDICFVKPSDIVDGTVTYLDDSEFYISEYARAKSRVLPPNSVLVTCIGIIGKVAINNVECAFNQQINAIIPDQSKSSAEYLAYAIQNKQAEIQDIANAPVVPILNKSQFSDIEIKLPSLAEQVEIVRKLNAVDKLIALRKEQLAKIDQLVKARFVELFGDPEKNTFCWREQPLSEHLNVIGGYAFKSEQFSEEGIPVLRIGNINSGFFKPVNLVFWEDDDALSRYKMYPGDLVMSLTGTVGKDDYGNVCILGNDYAEYYLNQRNAKLELQDTMNKYYLSMLLKFEPIKKKLTSISRGVRQANISNKDILNLSVPIPPIELQNQFAAFVEQTDKSKLMVQKSLDKLEKLKKALMQEYFG